MVLIQRRRKNVRRLAQLRRFAQSTICGPNTKPPFRGSVATLLGSPASPLRQRLLENADRPLKPGEFEKFLQRLAADTGSSHDLLDLWWRNIPTLSEYGQGLSKPLMFYVANVLNAAQDAQDLNFA